MRKAKKPIAMSTLSAVAPEPQPVQAPVQKEAVFGGVNAFGLPIKGGGTGGAFKRSATRALDDLPHYWKHTSGSFHEENDSMYVKNIAHDLLNGTKLDKATFDRARLGGRQLPGGFKIVKAIHVEDSALWRRYINKCKEINKKSGAIKPIQVKIDEYLPQDMFESLNEEVNEVYLFHGTSMEAAKSISKTGFKIELAGKAAGTAFGKGAYFAERSTKSDEYTVAETVNGESHYAMLLCRVCLGEIYRIIDFDLSAERHVLESGGRYHSLLGDREASSSQSYREFIVYEEDQVYPEYVIIYKTCEE